MAPVKTVRQSKRLYCDGLSVLEMENLVELISSNVEINCLVWSSSTLYLETNLKKTAAFFTNNYPALVNRVTSTKCLDDVIAKDNVKGKFGKQPTSTKIRLPKDTSGMDDTLDDIYEHCVEHGERPKFTDRKLKIHYALNRTKYEKVISMAMDEARLEEYDLKPLPWQTTKVVQLVTTLEKRQVFIL